MEPSEDPVPSCSRYRNLLIAFLAVVVPILLIIQIPKLIGTDKPQPENLSEVSAADDTLETAQSPRKAFVHSETMGTLSAKDFNELQACLRQKRKAALIKMVEQARVYPVHFATEVVVYEEKAGWIKVFRPYKDSGLGDTLYLPDNSVLYHQNPN
jgi:hypothetical protein